jgi:hypothetical protein
MPSDDPSPPPPAIPSRERLYPRLLGDAWDTLDPALQRIHTDPRLTHAAGLLQVSRAPGRLLGLLLTAARVPQASDRAQVRLAVETGDADIGRDGGATSGPVERWHRVFDGHPLVTLQSEAPGGLLAERVGILEFRFQLAVKRGEPVFLQHSLVICLGGRRLPLPHWLAPRIAARESAIGESTAGQPDQTRVDLRVMAPGGSLLFSYRGTVRWDS